MKKVIVVIISILFLSVFLMMNYLLWDKDNLLKQQEDNQIQQDWLRGQNSTLSDDIRELETAKKKLEAELEDATAQNNSLQRQLTTANGRETTLRRGLDAKNGSLEALKTASLPILRTLLSDWMTTINEGRTTDSYLYFTPDFRFLQKSLSQEDYRLLIESSIKAITFVNTESADGSGTGEASAPPPMLFERIGGEIQDLSVLVRAQVQVERPAEKEQRAGEIQSGLNTFHILYQYDTINQKWYIQTIDLGS